MNIYIIFTGNKISKTKKIFTTILVIIFSKFATFKYSFNLHQVKRYVIFSRKNIVDELLQQFLYHLTLRILGNQEIQETIQIGWKQILLPSLSPRNETLIVALKNYAKPDIKVFWYCRILLGFWLFPDILYGIVIELKLTV